MSLKSWGGGGGVDDKQPNLTMWLTSWFPSIKTMIASSRFAYLRAKFGVKHSGLTLEGLALLDWLVLLIFINLKPQPCLESMLGEH